MPIHNFMWEDVANCLKAICLFPIFVLAPGYAIAFFLDLFDFRRRTAAFRFALSVPLSIAICPIVTYLLGRFCGMTVVWVFYAAAACAFLVAVFQSPRRFPSRRELSVLAAILGTWLVVALGSLIDIQVGDRLYYPTSSLDNSVRSAFVHSISATGIPPQTPLFLPGQPVPLRYHYFWLMMCSLAESAGGGSVSARQALIAGTCWCGTGLMALVALYLRLFAPARRARFRRRVWTALLLLLVTGLDIIPTALLLLLHAQGALGFVLPSVEWWNEHVDWFLYTTLWAPHALSSLLACFTGFLLLWKAPDVAGRRRLCYAGLAGLALASSVGESIYVAFVFAVFLAAWTVITVLKKWYREAGSLAIAGSTAFLLAIPYLLSLAGPGAGPVGGAPLQLTVRTFSLAALVPSWHGMSPTWRLILVNLPLVPFNYVLEFGFFFAVALIQWRTYRRSGAPLTRQQLACITMAATSTLICTFVRSSVIGCNDLGWRGFLIAQFIFLLWGADLLADGRQAGIISAPERALLGIFLALGGIGTVYDLTLTRVYPMLADRGIVPLLDWMSPDRQFGKRTYAIRKAYEWAQETTPETAAIQFNPKVVFQETTAMLYADRRAVAADPSCTISFGGDEHSCLPIVSRLNELYSGADSGIDGICANLPVDLLVAKDTDPVWRNRDSWVWREKPAFQSDYIRLFNCRKTRAGTSESVRQIETGAVIRPGVQVAAGSGH
jgi:hypothetical protein